MLTQRYSILVVEVWSPETDVLSPVTSGRRMASESKFNATHQQGDFGWVTPSLWAPLSSSTKCEWQFLCCATSYPTLCDSMDCSPTGSSVHGILQAWILEGLPCPLPGDLPHSGIKPASPALQASSLPLSHWGSPSEPLGYLKNVMNFKQPLAHS